MNSNIAPPPSDMDIRNDPDIKHLLSRMPEKVSRSFSDIQLMHVKTAIGGRKWGKHIVDIRGTFTLPFARWRYYYVFLTGRNRRQLSEQEQHISAVMIAIIVLAFFITCASLGLLSLYLVKSFSGIDLFPGFSFGIWDYFKTHF